MASKVHDLDLDLMNRGEHAALVRSEIVRRAGAIERTLMGHLFGKWRAFTLSGDDAKAGIAAICALRDLQADLERDIQKGSEARGRVIAQPIPGQR